MNRSKSLILASLIAISFSAQASGIGNTFNNPTANGGAGGQGGNGGTGLGVGVGVGVGVGQGGSATGGAATVGDIRNTNTNTALGGNANQGQGQDQAQGQQQGQMQQAISGGNQLEGNKTSVNVNSLYERSAPAVFAGNVPVVAKSCRLYFFGGGSNREGAVSGTLPIGNDKTCLVGVKIDLMERIGGFTVVEKQQVACGVEGMNSLQTCQDLKKEEARKQGYEGNDTRVIDRMVKF